MRTWVRVQRIPPMKDASSTMMKPSRLNWVDSNVNINRPQEISRTTRIRNGFCSERDRRDSKKQQEKIIEAAYAKKWNGNPPITAIMHFFKDTELPVLLFT